MKIIEVNRRRRLKRLTKKFLNNKISYKAAAMLLIAAVVVGLLLRHYFPIWS
jgi:triphosphoribosyl-dephospho-CoA synthetase